jgi:hypothetical protein
MSAPIAVALDAPDLATLASWAFETSPFVSTLKVGLEVFCRDGADAVKAAREAALRAGAADTKIFLDLKLHDIPATVAGAAKAVKTSNLKRTHKVMSRGGPSIPPPFDFSSNQTCVTRGSDCQNSCRAFLNRRAGSSLAPRANWTRTWSSVPRLAATSFHLAARRHASGSLEPILHRPGPASGSNTTPRFCSS